MINNEHTLTKVSFLLMKVLLGIVLVADISRFIYIIDKYVVVQIDIWNLLAHLVILLSTALLFVLILRDNKRVPVYWFVVFCFQILSFVSINSIMLNDWTFFEFWPIVMTLIYFISPVLLTLVDIVYSISLTFLTEGERKTASKKGRDFGEFLKVENKISNS
jgi:hypothetical protein